MTGNVEAEFALNNRNSTVASLAAPSFLQIRATSVVKQESQSIIKTLTVGEYVS